MSQNNKTADFCLSAVGELAKKWTAQPICATETFVKSIPSRILSAVDINAATQLERNYTKRFKPPVQQKGDIGIITIEGAISRKIGIWDALIFDTYDMEWAMEDLKDLSTNPEVRGILLKVDTPGGTVTMVPEFARMIRQVDKSKPVVAYADGLMASAGYWFSSQARKLVAGESARVGSIGVYTSFIDWSEYYKNLGVSVEVIRNTGGTYKGQGFPGTSLSEEFKEHLKQSVDETFKDFTKAVTRTRDVPESAMQGQVFSGRKAQQANLIDAVGGFDFALAVLRREIRQG